MGVDGEECWKVSKSDFGVMNQELDSIGSHISEKKERDAVCEMAVFRSRHFL